MSSSVATGGRTYSMRSLVGGESAPSVTSSRSRTGRTSVAAATPPDGPRGSECRRIGDGARHRRRDRRGVVPGAGLAGRRRGGDRLAVRACVARLCRARHGPSRRGLPSSVESERRSERRDAFPTGASAVRRVVSNITSRPTTNIPSTTMNAPGLVTSGTRTDCERAADPTPGVAVGPGEPEQLDDPEDADVGDDHADEDASPRRLRLLAGTPFDVPPGEQQRERRRPGRRRRRARSSRATSR